MDVVLVGAELEENLALRYLDAALRAEGRSVRIAAFDGPADIERVAAEIADAAPRVVGLSMVFTRRADEFAMVATRARELGYRGLVLAGGHFAAFHAETLLGEVQAIDAIAIGEGEHILCAVARDPARLDAVAGLVWRDGTTIRTNERAVPEQDLDKLPWPTHRRPFDAYLGLPIVNMIGSRGCAHGCSFCSIAAWHRMCGGARYRARSAASVAAEMGCLYREGVRLFNFHDDNFLGRDREENIARARALKLELERQGTGKLAFQIKARPDAVDPELFALLRSFGLFRVFLGIEAGTERSLRDLGRGQKLADNVRALEVLNGLDLHVAFNLLVLNPESTLDDLAGNVAFLRAHLANPMNFCRTEIYAGTPLERRLRNQGRLEGSFWGLDYVIDDREAQRAFELFREAFFDRNFGAHPLHYLSSQVDYEHQIRADFFGTTPAVRAAAKGFVRSVNENTVGYLEEVLAAVRAGTGTDAFAAKLTERVALDDARLHGEGRDVLAVVRDIPDRSTKKRAARAKTAFAASLALAIAGCPARETHPMEAAPPPPPTSSGAPPNGPEGWGTAPMEAAPYPPDRLQRAVEEQGSQDAGPDAGDAGADAPVDAKPDAKKPPPRDAGAARPPTFHSEMAPHPMEAAPRWDPKRNVQDK